MRLATSNITLPKGVTRVHHGTVLKFRNGSAARYSTDVFPHSNARKSCGCQGMSGSSAVMNTLPRSRR